MNTKKISLYILSIGILASILILSRNLVEKVLADEDSIVYPVVDLGNCKSKDACKSYCDKPENISACVAFAEKNKLMSQDEINGAKKFIDAGVKGPGGCSGKDACEEYCNYTSHINECIAYAEQTGILTPKELAEAKQVQSAIQRGIQPPPCNGKKQCDTYCENPKNIKECVDFGESAGFLQGEELADARKMIIAVENGAVPPKCSGKEECDNYCSQDSNIDECIKFAIAAGFMSEKDAEIAKKTGGKGPGGCKGKEECDTFCQNPSNEQICINFGRDNGLIDREELQKMEEGDKKFTEAIQNAPPKTKKCLEEAFGSLDNVVPSRANGEKMSVCFKEFAEEGLNIGEQENINGEGRTGPGGCNSPESCDIYCKENPETCGNSGPQNGPQNNEQQNGPQGEQQTQTEEQTQQLPQREFVPEPTGDEQSQTPAGAEGESSEPVSVKTPSNFFLNLLANVLLAK